MILRITVGDNDFTAELEEFARDPAILRYFNSENISWEAFRENERFLELIYRVEKYSVETIDELISGVTKRWELFVNHVMKPHEWWSAEDTVRVKKYLIDNFKVKFQKSLTPKWENGEVVYICLGYPQRYWTF